MRSIEEHLEKLQKSFKSITPEELERRRKENLERELTIKQYRIKELWESSNVPKRHLEKTIDSKSEWFDLFNRLSAKLGTGCLVALVGGRGSGKTQCATELMKLTINSLKPAKYITAIGFFMLIKTAYVKDSGVSEFDIIKRFKSPSLLVIDEIGKRGDSEWENNLMFELINDRYNQMQDTVLIDNRTRTEFIAMIGPNLASRMNETGGIIEFTCKSFRE